MSLKMKSLAAILLSAGLVAVSLNAAEPAASDKKATKPAAKSTAKKKEVKPTVQQQIDQLREEFKNQVDGLKTDIATKDQQLKKAEQDAEAARQEAARANAAVSETQQAISNNASAVSTLDATVKDLKANTVSLTTTLSDETTKLKKSVESPSTLHFKGTTITPYGFVNGETVYRTHATGGGLPTALNALPYEGADAYSLSEFNASASQSRIGIIVEGKTDWGTLRGYFEGDFLGVGTTSNANQSNSYMYRQRVLAASAETKSGWLFAGGQLWSLAAENKKGISIAPSEISLPLNIDPNYIAGLVWARQYGFRVAKNFKHVGFGVSVENPQLLYSAALAGNTPYAVLGSAGTSGGLYNAAISSVSATTYVKSFSNLKTYDSAGNTVYTYVPNYATVTANSNLANISFNQAPDVIAKVTFDPGWGHYEIIGIGGFAHETVYPGVTQNSVKYGGVVDIMGFNGGTAGTAAVASSSTAGYYSNSIKVGGFAASLRVPVIKDKLTFAAKGLWGPGVGRYGDSTLSDVTNDATGQLKPIHNGSALLTLEANPTKRLTVFLNYGGDYAARADYSTTAITLGDPKAYFCPATAGAFTCTASPTAANFEAGGSWGSHFTATPVITPIGYGSKYANNTGCNTVATPGYNSGGSTGYLGGGSCGANTRSVQEVMAGYWYDIYKGDKGRLRQAFQYSYAVREGWSGTGTSTAGTFGTGYGAKGIENMFFTSFRYYLP